MEALTRNGDCHGGNCQRASVETRAMRVVAPYSQNTEQREACHVSHVGKQASAARDW